VLLAGISKFAIVLGAVGRSAAAKKTMSSVKATQLRPGMVIQHEGPAFHHLQRRSPHAWQQARLDADAHEKPSHRAIIDTGSRRRIRGPRHSRLRSNSNTSTTRATILHFMNTKNYEQMQMNRESWAKRFNYLIPSTLVRVEFFRGKSHRRDLPTPWT